MYTCIPKSRVCAYMEKQRTCMCAYIFIDIRYRYTCIDMCTYTHTAYSYAQPYVYVPMYVCIYIDRNVCTKCGAILYICIYIYIHTHRLEAL